MMIDDALLLPTVVLLPLLAAVVTVGVPARYRTGVGMVGALVTATATLAVVVTVYVSGPMLAELAGRVPPLGIALRADGPSAIFLLVGAVVGTAVSVHAVLNPASTGADVPQPWFWPLWLLAWTGLNAVFVAGDLFNTYVALEVLALAAVALVALGGAKSWAAAFRYLIVAVVGSLLFLLAVTLVYAASGTLDIALAGRLLAEQSDDSPHLRWILALTAAGMALKTALFPVHGWLPEAHSSAPAAVSPLLSALVVKASFYVLVRVWFDVTGPDAAIGAVLGAAGAASVLWAGLLALRQQTFKRVVAYSTISQIGYLFLLFPLVVAAGADEAVVAGAWVATALLVAGHALSKASIFLVAGTVKQAAGSDRLTDQLGTGHYLPMPAMAAGLAAIGLAGLPFSLGFLAKWQLMTVAVTVAAWWVIVVVIAGSVLAAAYLLRPLHTMLAARDDDGSDDDGSDDGSQTADDHPRAQRLGLRPGMIPLALAVTAVVAVPAAGFLETLALIGVSAP